MDLVEILHKQWIDETDNDKRVIIEDTILRLLFIYYSNEIDGYPYIFDLHYINHINRTIKDRKLKLKNSVASNERCLAVFKLTIDNYANDMYVDFISEETYRFLERYNISDNDNVSVLLNHISNFISASLNNIKITNIEYVRRSI